MLLRSIFITESLSEAGDIPFTPENFMPLLKNIDTSSSQWRRTKRGSINTSELQLLQRVLQYLDYKPGKPDGWFGKKTARAVMAFQKDHDLTVDGDPGKNTIAKIISVIEATMEGTPDNPRKVTRLIVGQLNDYVFAYNNDNYNRLKATHEVVQIDDYGNRASSNPRILMPRMPMQGQPPTNPEGPLYTGQGVPIEAPEAPDAELDVDAIGRSIDSAPEQPAAQDNTPARTTAPTTTNPGRPTQEVGNMVRQAYNDQDYEKALKIINSWDRLKAVWQGKATANGSTLYKDLEALVAQQESTTNEAMAWARSGTKVVRKYRCSSGSRKGRIVADVTQCFKAPDIKKRATLKKTKARLGSRMARKSKRTKKINPASRRIQALNK